jgi:chemotaxis response regulator CheB
VKLDGPASGPVRVVVVDDHETVRAGVRASFAAEGDLLVVGDAALASRAATLVAAVRPDVTVVDLALGDADGVALCRDLLSSGDTGACVVLTSYSDDEARLAAAAAGAAAFVAKSAPVDDLIAAVRGAAAGVVQLQPDTARRLLRARADADPRSRLSPQEGRILHLIADGLTNRRIGERLHLTEKTVKNYVSRLLRKLDLQRRSEAAALAARLITQDRLGRPWQRHDSFEANPPRVPMHNSADASGLPDDAASAGCHVVAVGASAGGLAALRTVLGRLPADFPAPIAIVQHVDPRHRTMLAEILDRHCALTVKEAEEGEALIAGTVYVARPDDHLIVTAGLRASFVHTAQVSFTRPSIDVLFASVADTCGAQAVAVVLTGTGHDGAAGAQAIDRAGGAVVVQDPATADFPSMPNAVVDAVDAVVVVALDDIGAQLQGMLAGHEHR